ncbi:type III secretion system chaperone family protein [Roseobacter sp. HKCCD5988]|uniref:YbjN domain-containing protein n=1 Tax=Roseobacter sp. HKCCD5988 TaxID=3120338 RepID=UPI0030EBE0A7
MSLSEQYMDVEDLHPIDIVETLATRHEWDFDRVADDQIAMALEGQWRTYSVTLAWSSYDETLRMICTFDMDPPVESMGKLYETLNLANDKCWAGAFSFWAEQKMMVYRYGLVLAGDQLASPEQIACMVETAILASERYYPAFQLACWGSQSPSEAIQVAIAEGFGRA